MERDLAYGSVLLGAVATGTWWHLDTDPGFFVHTLVLYALLVALVLWRAPEVVAGTPLGPANRLTLLRAILIAPVAALTLHTGALDPSGYWWIIGVSTVAMVLDGLDGPVARRSKTTSRFGARFDMELDAFLLLALSFLVWLSGQVGAWVILIGALRYLFVGASAIWPALRGDLPPSRRRKTVCVMQGVVLLVCLGPVVPAGLASGLAALALGLLLYSFAVDVRWLIRPVWRSAGGEGVRDPRMT